MNIGKVAIQTVVLSLIILLVAYLLNRSGFNFSLRGVLASLGIGKDVDGMFGELADQLNSGGVLPTDSYQEGCPTAEDIIEAYENNCMSFYVGAGSQYNNGLPGLVTNYACWDPSTVLTENMCSTVVLELRNRLLLFYDIDTFPDTGDYAMDALQGTYLDSNLYSVMQSITAPTTNGYTLGQFASEYAVFSMG